MKNNLRPNLFENGLEVLVEQIQRGGISSITASWKSWFERAIRQLEVDDTLDPHLTDVLADRLVEADEALEVGEDGSLFLNDIVDLFQDGGRLERRWEFLAQNLTNEELETITFLDLKKALAAAEQGSLDIVNAWIDLVEDRFISTWEGYEESTVLPEEVTAESVLGHRYLTQGVEIWIEALVMFRNTLESGLDREEILALAEQAQRYLVVVEVEQKRNTPHLALFS